MSRRLPGDEMSRRPSSRCERARNFYAPASFFQVRMALISDWFDVVFRERYPALVQVLHGLAGDRATAEDLAQEAFVRLWKKGPQKRPDADYWVTRVGRNLALDELRSSRRRAQRELAAVLPDDAKPFDDDDVARVRTVVASMRPRDREVLLLQAVGELPMAEIAKVVGRSANAVKQDLFRARERLRRLWFAAPEARQ